MKRFRHVGWLVLSSLAIVCIMLFQNGLAQLAVRVIASDGTALDVTGRNVSRGDEALILYDRAFGASTRTNGFGVEVIAVPAEQASTADGLPYRVQAVTSVWECQKNPALTCGNAAIPEKGIVLSATGGKRELIRSLQPGQTLVLQEEWFQRRTSPISVINPSPETNPVGSGFPGFRASNQLIVYDRGYGRPSTGTNEFGFEVTVRNGVVVEQEGSDSAIPADGFVASGHGKARSWLIANAPMGARLEISEDGKTLTSTVDFETYLYQFDRRWAESPCCKGTLISDSARPACNRIREQRDQALQQNLAGRAAQAASTLGQALESLNRRIWLSYEAFPADTLKGAWHRPVEKTPEAIGQTLDSLKAAGLNAVFLETYFHGYTIFPSHTYAEYGLPVQNPKFVGLDLLKAWTEEAHKRGMKVHVWFQTFYAGTNAYLPPGPVLAKYPQWANVQYSALVPEKPATPADPKKAAGQPPEPVKLKHPGKLVPSTLEQGAYFIDPAHPEARAFLMKLIDEIVTRYPVDGFQLDYIRYPASFPSDRFSFHKTTWGYSDYSRAQFKARTGYDPAELNPKDPAAAELWKAWNEFKNEQVSSFVQQASEHIRRKKPGVLISAAIFPEGDNTLAVKHQDWRNWARNGWLDFIAPMTLTSAAKVVEHNTRYVVSVTNGRVPVFSGLFGPFNDNTAEHVLSQIDTAKRAGASGYVLFDTAHLTGRMLEALKASQTPQPSMEQPAIVDVPPTPAPKPEKKRRLFGLFGRK